VRVVLKDGIEHFATSVIRGQVAFNTNEIRMIVEKLTRQIDAQEEPSASEGETLPKQVVPRQASPVDRLMSSAKNMGWSKRQWVLLGVAIFFQAIILILFFVLIMVALG
jgi:hypothetical protein